jgi:NAD-dependent dihydropyrimidine dehydrogenase PreA subunit
MARLTYLKDVATLALDPELCIGCGLCEIVCPHEVFTMTGQLAVITGRDDCMECGACARNCPTDAIAVTTGVGCAAAVISSALGVESACCSLDQTESDGRPSASASCGCC